MSTVATDAAEEITNGPITVNCPVCGLPFTIPLDLLDYFAQHGCAACASLEKKQ